MATAKEGLDLCKSLLEKVDELPERAEEFADSVRDKTENIQQWMEENDHATDAQITALENMESGVDRWLH